LIATSEGSTGPVRSEELHPSNDETTTYPLYWIVSNSGAGGETPPETTDPVITINVADATNATVTVDGVGYSADATYKYTGNDVVIVATANNGYTYTDDVEADAGWTIAGDGTKATYTVSGITANVEVTVPVAVVKAPQGPTKWEDVTKDTQVSDVVDSDSQKALAGSGVTVLEIKAWAQNHSVSLADGPISVTAEALMLNCPNTAKDIADAKEAFKVDDTILERIMANLEDITKVNLSEIKAQYPYANIVLEKVPLAGASENAEFFKLKMTLK
jgi:hypothetical protein